MAFNIIESPIIRQYGAVILVNLSMLSAGLGLVWPSPVLVKLSNVNQTVLPEPITENQGSWVVSIGFLTGMTANVFMAFLVELVGRKHGLILSCIPTILAAIVFTFSSEIWMLLVGRALIGISNACIFTFVPMFASEIASKEIRGSLGAVMQILCSTGIVIMLSVGPFIDYVPLNIFYICMTSLATLPLFLLYDSPYYLYSKGKKDEALKVLTFYRGSEALAHEEMKEYEIAELHDEKVNKKDILTNRLFIKSLILVIVLGWGCQFVGSSVVTFYLQTILESTGTSVRSEIASVIIGVIQLLGSITPTFLIDRFGRRPILAITCVIMGIGMFGLGLFFQLTANNPVTGVLNYLPLVSIMLVIFCYDAGLGSLFWVLSAELFDDKSRGMGMSINLVTMTFFVFLTTKFFAQVTSAIGPAFTYWIFSFNCILISVFVLCCIPETKGKTFAEIQLLLGKKKKTDRDEENNKTRMIS